MAENIKLAAVTEDIQKWVDQIGSGDLILALAGDNKTIGYFANQALNGASAQDIHLFEFSGELKSGLNCDLQDSTATFTDRQIVPTTATEQFSLCKREMWGLYLASKTNFKSGDESVPFEEKIMGAFKKDVNKNVENLLWNGSSALNAKGIVDIVSQEGVTVKAGSTANVYEMVLAGIKALPAASAKETVFYVSNEVFVQLKMDLLARDFRLIDMKPATEIDSDDVIVMPMFGTKIVKVDALAGNQNIIALVPQHVVVGVDQDGSDVNVVFDPITEKTYFKTTVILGVQIAYPSETLIIKAED